MPSQLSSQLLCGNTCTWTHGGTIPINQRVLKKLSKEHNIGGHKWSTTHRIKSNIIFGSLVPAMCNSTSCAQVHELPQSYCGDNWEGTLFSWLHIYNFKMLYKRVENFHKKSYFYSGFNKFWIVQNSFPIIEQLNKTNAKKKASRISTFISALYIQRYHMTY